MSPFCLLLSSLFIHFCFTALIFTCMMMHHYRHSRSSSSSTPLPLPQWEAFTYLVPYKKHCELALYIVLTKNTQFSWNGLHWWFYLQYTSLLLNVGQGCSHQLWSGQVSTVYTCRHTTGREIWGHVSHTHPPPPPPLPRKFLEFRCPEIASEAIFGPKQQPDSRHPHANWTRESSWEPGTH